MRKHLLVCSLLLSFLLASTANSATSGIQKVYPGWKVVISFIMGGKLILTQERDFREAALRCHIVTTQNTARFHMEMKSSQGLGTRRIKTYFDEGRDMPYSQTLESRFAQFCGATPPLNIADYSPDNGKTNW